MKLEDLINLKKNFDTSQNSQQKKQNLMQLDMKMSQFKSK
jgi:hypothetical protein